MTWWAYTIKLYVKINLSPIYGQLLFWILFFLYKLFCSPDCESPEVIHYTA